MEQNAPENKFSRLKKLALRTRVLIGSIDLSAEEKKTRSHLSRAAHIIRKLIFLNVPEAPDTTLTGKARIIRWYGWLTLAILSTFFTELTSASKPFAFFYNIKWFLMVPFYGLHILVLGSLFFNQRKQSFASLYILGIFFGMYEAYATKVIWDPNHEVFLKLGGVSLLEIGLLAFFWHAFMAFIFPLLIAEHQLSQSANVWNVMPRIIRRFRRSYILVMVFAVFCGLLHGAAMKFSGKYTVSDTIVTTLGACAIVYLFMLVWWLLSRNGNIRTADLLPSLKERRILLIALGLIYIYFFLSLHGIEKTVGLIGHLCVITMYIFMICIRHKALDKKAKQPTLPADIFPHKRLLWPVFSLLFVAASIAMFFSPVSSTVMKCYFFGFSVFGYIMFFSVAFMLLVKPRLQK